MAIQEELEKIKKQAEQIKGQVDTLASAENMGMNITPKTTITEAEQFLKSKQTSSSFDVGSDIDKYLANLGINVPADNLSSLVQRLSQTSNIEQATEKAKEVLTAGKQQAIDLAKSFMETEQEKVLSALGLKTGVGSLIVEGINDVQRKNALSLANLATQYDQAIANLDLQKAEQIRNETINLINTIAQIDNMKFNQKLSLATTAFQMNQEQVKNLFDTISDLISNETAKSLDDLPQKKKEILEPMLRKIDTLSNLPAGTTRMKIEKMLLSGPPLQNAKIITTNDGGIYMFGTKGNNVVFQQLKAGTPKSISGSDISTFNLDYLTEKYLDSLGTTGTINTNQNPEQLFTPLSGASNKLNTGSSVNSINQKKQLEAQKTKQAMEQIGKSGFGEFFKSIYEAVNFNINKSNQENNQTTIQNFTPLNKEQKPVIENIKKETYDSVKNFYNVYSSSKKFVPADLSSFIDTAETITNLHLLTISNQGINVTDRIKKQIYESVVKKMAQRGMLPANYEVNDKSLLILLYRKGEIDLPKNIDLSSRNIINQLSEKDKQIFMNKKDYYTNLSPLIQKIVFGQSLQDQFNIAIPLQQYVNQLMRESSVNVFDL